MAVDPVQPVYAHLLCLLCFFGLCVSGRERGEERIKDTRSERKGQGREEKRQNSSGKRCTEEGPRERE